VVTVDEFSRLVSGIYAAAVTPQDWEPAIRDIQRTLGATGGSLLLGGATWSFQNSTIPAAALESYTEHYAHLDYVIAAVAKGPVGAVRTGPEVIVPNRNAEFYAGWMRPNELEDGLFVRLTSSHPPTCFLVTSGSQSFQTPERLKLVNGLVGHLQQAIRTQNKLAALAHSAVEIAGVLDVIRYGVVVITREHLVINLNSAAERIFRDHDGLSMRSGRIVATSTQVERELHSAVQNAVGGDDSTIRRGRTLTCTRPAGKRPFVIHVLPSHRRDADEPLSQPMALVLIIDPEREPEPAATLLRRLYRLTKAEAEIALRVAHGADLKQISEELSVSLPTIRTHLQHVFDKTDTHRQAELVRLLFSLDS
jgi:DNA-binding CsgD family transcriptional regulator